MSYVRKSVVSVAAFALVFLSACSGSSSSKPDGHSLTATEREFSISLNSTAVQSGNVGIKVHNTGQTEHELVVFKTDLDQAALKLTPDGSKIDEKQDGVTHLDPEAEKVAPGSDKSITVDLAPGRYVVVCNLPGHYKQGMHATLDVT